MCTITTCSQVMPVHTSHTNFATSVINNSNIISVLSHTSLSLMIRQVAHPKFGYTTLGCNRPPADQHNFLYLTFMRGLINIANNLKEHGLCYLNQNLEQKQC